MDRTEPPRLGEGPTGGRHEIECRHRAGDIVPGGPDPCHAERRRRHVVRVCAGAGPVEALRDDIFASALTGQRQRQLGRKLAGHLPVDRIERRLAQRRSHALSGRPARSSRPPATPTGRRPSIELTISSTSSGRPS